MPDHCKVGAAIYCLFICSTNSVCSDESTWRAKSLEELQQNNTIPRLHIELNHVVSITARGLKHFQLINNFKGYRLRQTSSIYLFREIERALVSVADPSRRYVIKESRKVSELVSTNASEHI